jgi:chromosome segregation ATPase
MAQKATLQDGRVLCSKCSSPIKVDDTICSRCEEPLEGTIEAFPCPICNILLSRGIHKCHKCGLNFKPIYKKEGESHEEAFLGRLLRWEEFDNIKDTNVIIRPTIQKEEIERFEKKEAQAEKEESIQGLAESIKAVIAERRMRWTSADLVSLEDFSSLRNEERVSLEKLDDLAGKFDTLFKEICEKHKSEITERDEKIKAAEEAPKNEESDKIKAQLVVLEKEKEDLSKSVEMYREKVDILEKKLDMKEKDLQETKDKKLRLEELNNEESDKIKIRIVELEEEKESMSNSVEMYREKVDILEEKLGRKEKDLQETRDEKRQLEELKNEESDKIKARLADMEKEKEELTNSVEMYREKVEILDEKLSMKEKDLQETTDKKLRLEALNDELTELHKKVKDILAMIDELLGKLPDDEIKRFAQSEDYKRYAEVLDKYSI